MSPPLSPNVSNSLKGVRVSILYELDPDLGSRYTNVSDLSCSGRFLGRLERTCEGPLPLGWLFLLDKEGTTGGLVIVLS